MKENRDNGKVQYQEPSFYKGIVSEQMRKYDAEYPFSRGDTKVPSEMHGEKTNTQKGP